MRSLEIILASPSFQSSTQLPAFLDYVVNEELAGRGDKIKAYTVAVDALGRPESFDPSTDPVIRVIANRLRKALDGFYASEDADIPVRIELVRGSYRPVFHHAAAGSKRAAGQKAGQITEGQSPLRRTRPSRGYAVTISVLSVLLALALGYIGWHLTYHEHYDASYMGDVPPELAPNADPPTN